MRTVPWFERLDAEGVIAGWLASHNLADHAHAIEVMLGAATKRADRMAELLAPYAGHAADYPAWLSWITRFGNLYKSRALFPGFRRIKVVSEYSSRGSAGQRPSASAKTEKRLVARYGQ
jgi:hypothetical protein